MNITRWVNFTWDLATTELPELAVPRHYRIALAGAEDQENLQRVINKSLALDPSWNCTLHHVSAMVTNSITRALALETTVRLVLRHGTRIIGGTLLAADVTAPEHLVPGPCVLMEYRNRGLGTLLLNAALRELREAGLPRACAVTREGSPVARFVYPKFGGNSSPVAPLMAA
ncbi:MAG: GNAT family N-acetyltransferase [Verrucomicrobia bacterium]|nr:GNAT family N-acetyltransferase [Verrucomicrobiota bacterium]